MNFDTDESYDTKETLLDEPIQKNSTIEVTVDDLNEGIIVVSYAHQNKLYQGVLLQLARERGIPSGISFPKDFCTGTPCHAEEGENDPSQITPLTQRHTYFQVKDNGAADPSGINSRAGLRRIIKPPARFKNARMSLRHRARPVLCAKCKTLCEEIPENKDGSGKSKSKNSLKRNGSRKGQLSKNDLPNGAPAVDIETKPFAEITDLFPLKDDPADFSYEGVGTKDIIENYWRRPLTKPNSKAKNSQIPLQLDSLQLPFKESKPPGFNPIVPIPLSTYSKSTDFSLEHGTSENLNSITEPVRGVDTVIGNPPPRKRRKGKSFKLCLNSEVLSEDHIDEDGSSDAVDVKSEDSTTLNPAGCSEMFYTQVPVKSLPVSETVSNPSRSPVRRIKKAQSRAQSRKRELNSHVESLAKGLVSKDLLSTRPEPNPPTQPRSSYLPVRFRDETYKLTRKNMFNFKRRGGDETDQNEGMVPVFPDSLLGYTPSVISSKGTREEPEGSLISNEYTRASSSSSSASLVHTISSSNGHSNVSDTKKESGTREKIPVIKITFGSPGNGIVIIPPKSEYPTTSDPDISEADLKAIRKALRKAKREARRKGTTTSLEPQLTSPT